MPKAKIKISSSKIGEQSFERYAQTDTASHPTSKAKASFYKVLVFCIVVLMAVLAGGMAWQNYKLKNSLSSLENKLKSAQSESSKSNEVKAVSTANKELLVAVGKLMVLPDNEEPTIATVADLEKLKDQPFFVNAKLGDKVLIFATAKKAVLYRPDENKIIELAPLNIGTSTPSSGNLTTAPLSASSSPQKISVEIRNGSGKNGLAGQVKALLEADGEFSVIKTGNANTVYSKTTVQALTDKATSQVISDIKKIVLSDSAETLPFGEAKSSADALIILGK